MSLRSGKLTNAQVEVNRAVFLWNERQNGNEHSLDVSDKRIREHVKLAIKYLREATGGKTS